MKVKLRLQRHGRKKHPFYWIVATPSASPRDGHYVEKLGTYDPMKPSEAIDRVVLHKERLQYWLSVGAEPTERVHLFLKQAQLIPA